MYGTAYASKDAILAWKFWAFPPGLLANALAQNFHAKIEPLLAYWQDFCGAAPYGTSKIQNAAV